MGNRRRFVEVNTFDGDGKIPSRARKQKHHQGDLSFAERLKNEQRKKIPYFPTFSSYFSLQLEMRQKSKSQAAVMNVLHCSPLKSRRSAER